MMSSIITKLSDEEEGAEENAAVKARTSGRTKKRQDCADTAEPGWCAKKVDLDKPKCEK